LVGFKNNNVHNINWRVQLIKKKVNITLKTKNDIYCKTFLFFLLKLHSFWNRM